MNANQKAQAIELALEGETLMSILEIMGISARLMHDSCKFDIPFHNEFCLARNEGYELQADNLVGITTRIPDIQAARLESENMRWLLSKRKPSTYGDRIDVNVQHSVDIIGALSKARSRSIQPATLTVDAAGSQPVAQLASGDRAADPALDLAQEYPANGPGRPSAAFATANPDQPLASPPQRAISQRGANSSADAAAVLRDADLATNLDLDVAEVFS